MLDFHLLPYYNILVGNISKHIEHVEKENAYGNSRIH